MRTHPFRPAGLLAATAAAALGLALPAARAADINSLQLLSQAEFRLLSEDLGAALSFKPMIPSEGLGLTGFDIGFGVTGTQLAHRDIWQKAAGGSEPPSIVPVPFARVHKGLPLNIDIGATVSAVPSTDIKLYGGEVRWAVLPGSTATPAVALRASLTRMRGVDQLGLRTVGFDVSVSKGFAFLTPYAGIGTVQVRSKPAAASGLATESFNQTKFFAGANINLGLANVALEADRTGDTNSYGVKLGFRF